jgi:hypothetical protein
MTDADSSACATGYVRSADVLQMAQLCRRSAEAVQEAREDNEDFQLCRGGMTEDKWQHEHRIGSPQILVF